jgi:hypothetical protein
MTEDSKLEGERASHLLLLCRGTENSSLTHKVAFKNLTVSKFCLAQSKCRDPYLNEMKVRNL